MTSKKRWLRRILCSLGIGAAVVVIMIAISVFTFVKYRIPEMYAIWGVGELLVDHAKENDALPQSWTDLSKAWDDGIARHAVGVVTFEELQELIDIDFDRLGELELSYPEWRLIPKIVRCRSGSSARWAGTDANKMLNDYLRKNPFGEDRSPKDVP